MYDAYGARMMGFAGNRGYKEGIPQCAVIN